MAHEKQHRFILSACERFQGLIENARIVEIGSQDINGTVRDCFQGCQSYLGIDIGAGQAVDLVIPGELLELPSEWATIVISTECLEHASGWQEILATIIRITSSGGLVLLTFASFGRPAHGTIDSDSASSPFTNHYYKNLTPHHLLDAIQLNQYFSDYGFEVNTSPGDTYFWGIRSSTPWRKRESSEILEERLARAQGQLAQAVEKISKQEELYAGFRDLEARIKHKENQLQDLQAQLATTLGQLTTRTADLEKVQSLLDQKTKDGEHKIEEVKQLQDVIARKEQQSHGLLEQLADIRLDCDRAIDSAELATLRCRSFELESERFRTERDQLLQINSEYRRQCRRAVDLLYRIKAFSMTTDAVESQGSSR
ncbi:hypothetical protein [Synechococcus sp. CCY9202]|uniref:hypothetical protein n=1 Tax=Synechococcus sp. CCY9202 TaxID=174698 RepID=UPI002B1E92DA|nr:hypothetical protein [Synechococcus sp. CCY9202]MEA5424262.1 hypothetical protein [Synechococcus sp. CCY9202]